MIRPTVGRVVLFHPALSDELKYKGQPLAALIAYVHSDTLVNLAVFDHTGRSHGRTSIRLMQDGDELGPIGDDTLEPESAFAFWMPYQKGQAAKTEDVTATLEARVKDIELRLTEPPAPAVETKIYGDGTTATGPGPLPEQSPVDAIQEEPEENAEA